MAKLVWVVKHNGRAAQMTPKSAARLGLSVLSAADAAAYREGQAPALRGERGPEVTARPAYRSYVPMSNPASSPGEHDPDAIAAGTTEPQEG